MKPYQLVILLFLLVNIGCTSKNAGFFHYSSTNDGGSWSRNFVEISGATTEKVVDPGLMRLANGEILMYYLGANGDGDPASTQPDNTWRIGVARSQDNGKTFAQEKIVYSQNAPISDPEPLALTDGTFIIYGLDISNNAIVSFSSTGTDPTTFNTSLDSGNRATLSGTPGALAIGATYFIYGCNGDGMIRYSSTDGHTLTLQGTSIPSTDGYITCDASVQLNDDGRYIMVYKLSPNSSEEPKHDLIFWADSTDGATFTPRGLIGYGSVPGFVIDQAGGWHVYVPNYDVD